MVEVKEAVTFGEAGGTKCIGVTSGRDDTELIFSFCNGMIAVYDIHTQRCTKTWQLSVADTLTISATFDLITNLYNAVKNNNALLQWKHDVDWTSEFTVTQLQHRVHSLLTPPITTPTSSPIIVYENGIIEIGSTKKEIRNPKRKKGRNMNVVTALCWKSDTLCHVIVMCLLSQGSYCSVIYNINDGEIEEKGTTELKNFGELVAMETFGSFLITLWSSGIIYKTIVGEIITSPSSYSLHHLVKLDIQSSPTGLVAINSDYFAVISESILQIYDIKYGTLQTSKKVDTITSNFKLACCHGYLFVPSSSPGISGYPVICSTHITLATALGRSCHVQSVHSQWTSTKKEKTECNHQLVNDWFDKEDILKSCQLLMEDPTSFSRPEVMSKLTFIVEMLLDVKEVWPHSELSALVEAKAFPVNFTATLLEQCLVHSDWVLITSTLHNIDCVPERAIVMVLLAILELNDDIIIKIQSSIYTKTDLLCLVLSLPKNDTLIQQPLAKLSQDHLLTLLTFLAERIDGCIFLTTPTSVLHHSDVLDWLGLILDTHFTSLILIPSARPFLLKLRRKIEAHITFFSHLNSTLTQTASLQTQLANKFAREQWYYKLDKVNLKKNLGKN